MLHSHACIKFANLVYWIVSTVDLIVCKCKALAPIDNGVDSIAAWSEYNNDLQQYLVHLQNISDASVVTKYFGQLVQLSNEYYSQWKLIMKLDEYVRVLRLSLLSKSYGILRMR